MNDLMTNEQVTFQYANECDLEIHCSPFGLSGLYIKINGTNIMGIGSTMGLITGSTNGFIHYNDSNDLINQKYKLYVIVDNEGMLRIDFTKIFMKQDENGNEQPNENEDIKNKNVLNTNCNENSTNNGEEDDINIPTLIFRGKCPEGRPDDLEPFIGIFSFERETI
ncbi:unnamed protein product [Candida verbasci]|uniref:Uncharacterized protein n=1 Tax=Candida verbasci TaxID=1227364 RepID=A0A9W4TSD0_9ASCO|nr:unnamed protein product [Candida verbasci]